MNDVLSKFETNVTKRTFNGRRIFGYVHPTITGKMRVDLKLNCKLFVIIGIPILGRTRWMAFSAKTEGLDFAHFTFW